MNSSYKNFQKKLKLIKKTYVIIVFIKNKKIYGYGASTKGMYYFNIIKSIQQF